MPLLPFLLRLTAMMALVSVPTRVFATGTDIRNMALGILTSFFPVIIPIAVLVIVIAGFILMTSQDEGKLQKAKSTIIAVAIGAILVGIFWAFSPLGFIGIMYNGMYTGLVTAGSTTLSLEAAGVSDWLTGMAAIFGVLIIVVAMLRAVLSFGGDESAYSKARYSILHVIAGMAVIALAYIFKNVVFFDREPSAILIAISGWIFLIIAVISTIAMAILIYAGLRMVLSFGREEEFTKARSLAIRVIVGLVILALSFVLVWIVTQIF